MPASTRRGFLATTAAATAAACAPAAAPPSAPAASPSGGSKAAWEQQWDQLVDAAKKEGKLSTLSLVGVGYRNAMDAFEKAFGIQVEHDQAPSATVWVPKRTKEREAGINQLDVAIVPPNSAITSMRPAGAWDPIKPVIFRPDVLDDKVWRDGIEGRYMDKEKQIAFAWEYHVQHVIGIDTSQVKTEPKSMRDLLDPQWKGKIIMIDPRFGDGYLTASNYRKQYGDDFVKQYLVDQQPQFTREPRQVAENVIRGRNPIGQGMRVVVLKEFRDQGVTGNLKLMDFADADFVPATSIFLANKAPHPNAAKLFINWFLTKEGQPVFSKELPTNSARNDVEVFVPEGAPGPGKQYLETGKGTNYDWIIVAQSYINCLLSIAN